MTDPNAAPAHCQHCGRELDEHDPAPLCTQCSVLAAEGSLDHRVARTPHEAPAEGSKDARVSRTRRTVGVIAIVAALAVLAVEVPFALRTFAPPAPRHQGAAITDARTSACVSNLWVVLAAVTEGRSYKGQPTCPVTGAAYVVSHDGAVTVVSCPNPASHGLSQIYIRSDSTLPVVK